MNSKLIKLKQDIESIKPSREEIMGKQLQELMILVRNREISFDEFMERMCKVYK